MIYPKFLQNNNKIGIPTPSDGASSIKKINKFKSAKKYFESLGYSLELSKNIYKSDKGRSSDAYTRAEEVNKMFKSKDIDLILCATGGDFLVEILPYINFSLLVKNPKYIAGFSDPTGLLFTITTKYDIATIYGNNFSSFGQVPLHKSHDDYLALLEGKKNSFESYDLYEDEYRETITGLEPFNLDRKVEWKSLNNKDIDVEGRIIGGCLDIISELAGTKYDGINEFNEKYKKDGIIWYFDNCELSLDEVIRTLWKLNELNYFKYTKGIIFGRFGNTSSYYEYNTKTCLEDSIISNLSIPIIYDADVSHKSPCIPILNGSIAHIVYKDKKAKISYSLD